MDICIFSFTYIRLQLKKNYTGIFFRNITTPTTALED